MKDDLVYVHHILDASTQILKYVRNLTYKKFLRSRITQDAVVRQITIIGEASRQLSVDFQRDNSQIPWSNVIGMRHKLVHDYLGTDLGEVWRVTQDDLPLLKKQLRKILRDTRKKTGRRSS